MGEVGPDCTDGSATFTFYLHADGTDDDRGPGLRGQRHGADGELALADVHAFSLEAPWARAGEPEVVPPVLDGKHAVPLRLAAVVVLVCGILASLVLAITAAVSLTEVIGGRPDSETIS